MFDNQLNNEWMNIILLVRTNRRIGKQHEVREHRDDRVQLPAIHPYSHIKYDTTIKIILTVYSKLSACMSIESNKIGVPQRRWLHTCEEHCRYGIGIPNQWISLHRTAIKYIIFLHSFKINSHGGSVQGTNWRDLRSISPPIESIYHAPLLRQQRRSFWRDGSDQLATA